MIPKLFQYAAPETTDEAIELLKQYNENAKLLAGGMSFLPILKLRLASPSYVIDLNRVSGLEYIREGSDGKLLIGPMTRHHNFETSQIIATRAPIMADTASWIADPQVRNMGTIGGALCHADPAGDWASTMLALRAEMVARSSDNTRTVKSDDFFVDTFTSALTPEEILTEIRVPSFPGRSAGAYAKLERKAGDFATVGVAVQISLDDEGIWNYAGVGLTSLGPKNLRAKRAEDELLGSKVNEDLIENAAAAASVDSQPEDDPLRGSAEYKRAMARVFTKRALKSALSRIIKSG